MPFAKSFEKSRIHEYRHLYCDYTSLKALVKQMTSNLNSDAAADHVPVTVTAMFNLPYHAIPQVDANIERGTSILNRDAFQEAYEQEVSKVNQFFKTKYEEIEARLSGAFASLAKVITQFKILKQEENQHEEEEDLIEEEEKGSYDDDEDAAQEASNDEDEAAREQQRAKKYRKMVETYQREKQECELDGDGILKLARFAEQNILAFKKIAAKYGKHVNKEMVAWLLLTVEKQQFFEANIEALILAISDVYRNINWIERKQFATLKQHLSQDAIDQISTNLLLTQSGEENNQEMTDYEQHTETFWIEPELVTQVRLLLAKRIPILLFGKDVRKAEERKIKRYGTLTKNFWTNLLQQQQVPDENGSIKMKIASLVNAVYYDTESFACYKGRTLQSNSSADREEATYRCSWYDVIEPTKMVYMERKMRNVAPDAASLKQGFELPVAQLQKFIKGEWTLDEQEVAKKIKDKSKIAEIVLAAAEIQQKFQERQLIPSVRTMNLRTRYEAKKNSAFRAKLDTHLCFFEESREAGKPFISLSESSGPAVQMFSKAILELKYCTPKNNPTATVQWINELVNMKGVVKRPFSKFVHATAVCHPQVRSIQEPSWLASSEHKERKLGKDKEQTNSQAELQQQKQANDNLSTLSAFSKKSSIDLQALDASQLEAILPAPKKKNTAAAAVASEDSQSKRKPPTGRKPSASSSDQALTITTPKPQQLPQAQPILVQEPIVTSDSLQINIADEEVTESLPLLGRRKTSAAASKTAPKYFTSQATPAAAAQPSFLAKMVAFPTQIYGYITGGCNNGNGKSNNKSKEPATSEVAEKISMKWIKTAMSNERTLLAWLHPVVVLIGVAISLMGLGTKSVSNLGLMIAALAILFSGYALYKFYRRRTVIGSRKGCGFDDAIGPTILVLLLVFALVASAVVTVFYDSGLFNHTIDWPSSQNDTLIDNKFYQVDMSINQFSQISREFSWQEYYNYLHNIPLVADVAFQQSYAPDVKHEERAVLKNPTEQILGNVVLKARESLIYNEKQRTFTRKDNTIEVSMKYTRIKNPATFVRPTINFRAPYVYDHEEKMDQDVYCDAPEISQTTTVTLLVPPEYKLTNETIPSLFDYFDTNDEITEKQITYTRSNYLYNVNVGMTLGGQLVKNAGLTFKYLTLEELISGKSSFPVDENVEFKWKIDKFQFNKLNNGASQLHQYMCGDVAKQSRRLDLY